MFKIFINKEPVIYPSICNNFNIFILNFEKGIFTFL